MKHKPNSSMEHKSAVITMCSLPTHTDVSENNQSTVELGSAGIHMISQK